MCGVQGRDTLKREGQCVRVCVCVSLISVEEWDEEIVFKVI